MDQVEANLKSANGNKMDDDASLIIEKVTIYESKNLISIIGMNNAKDKFRVAKIDRSSKKTLCLTIEKRVLNLDQLAQFRKQEELDKKPVTHAFGIVGCVRFLEGYYLIVITKRRCVAMIGQHCVFKIEDIQSISIANDKSSNPDEAKYIKIFNNVDMKSNFYFSYSYDLSNTLQYNLAPLRSPTPLPEAGFGHHTTLWDLSEAFTSSAKCGAAPYDGHRVFIKPNVKFVWNSYLIEPMLSAGMHNDFNLYLVHGFVSQAMLPISGRNLVITLIARRSQRYAGTRFLKRGANCEGYPANEIETEQIVHDANIASFASGLFTSFVQIRGSVPTYWSQSIARVGSKPPIVIDLKDPFYEAAGKHFNHLLYHYGSPVLVLNLVKRKEKKPHECILYNEFEAAVEYVNQFLSRQHQLLFVGFDMARCNKAKDESVLVRLTEIAEFALKKNGFFQNRPLAINRATGWPRRNALKFRAAGEPIYQMGIVRVNCVDCLDRTNTAQFAMGRVALAHQLCSMGMLYKPQLTLDSDVVRLLEELYEDHGDTIAMQYGGSQLVHRIQTYRKNAPLTSQSKDILQSLSRYYSNAFSDWDKQNAINLFLGIFKPYQAHTPIWSILSDYNLHHNFLRFEKSAEQAQRSGSYTKFWSNEVALCLPRAAKEFYKDLDDHELSCCPPGFVRRVPHYDWFFDINRLQENINFEVMFMYNIKKSKTCEDEQSTWSGHGAKQSSLATSTMSFFLPSATSKNTTANRQSLVGIPLNTTGKDDSDNSDFSDNEEDNIIIRFDGNEHLAQEFEDAQEAFEANQDSFEVITSEEISSSLDDQEAPAAMVLIDRGRQTCRDHQKSFDQLVTSLLLKSSETWNSGISESQTKYIPVYEEFLWYKVRSHNFLRGYNDFMKKRKLAAGSASCGDPARTLVIINNEGLERTVAAEPIWSIDHEEILELCRAYGKYFDQDLPGVGEDEKMKTSFLGSRGFARKAPKTSKHSFQVYEDFLQKTNKIKANLVTKLKETKECTALCDEDSMRLYTNHLKVM